MKNKLFRTVEKFLYNQRAIEQAIAEAREIQFNESRKPDDNVGGGKSNSVGDPTGSKAIKLASPLRHVVVEGMGTVYKPETWVKVMDEAYAAQNDSFQKILRARYYRRMASVDALGIDFYRSRSGLYASFHEFVWEVIARAAASGLIRFEK